MKSVETTPESPVIIPYETRDYISIIVNSFRFSRGNPMAQYSMLHFISEEYSDRMDDLAITQSQDAINEATWSVYTNNHVRHKANGQTINPMDRQRIDDEAAKFIEFLLGEGGMATESQQARMTKGMLAGQLIRADLSWSHKRNHKLLPKKFMSNFIRYGVIGVSTGREEFDYIFDIATDVLKASTDLQRTGIIGDDEYQAKYDLENLQILVGNHLAVNPKDKLAIEVAIEGTNLEGLILPAAEARDKSTV